MSTTKPIPWANRVTGNGTLPANQYLAHDLNARRHPGPQRDALRGSLDAVGWVAPVIVSVRSGKLLDGHARIEEALSKDEAQEIPYVEVDVSEEEERLILATYDPIGALATYDREALDNLLSELTAGPGLEALLADLAVNAPIEPNGPITDFALPPRGSLTEEFVVPPFSVLDARQGYWQERKALWLALGIQSELGRGDNLLGHTYETGAEGLHYYRNLERAKAEANAIPGGSLLPAATTEGGKTVRGDGRGRKANAEPAGGGGGAWREFNEDTARRKAKANALPGGSPLPLDRVKNGSPTNSRFTVLRETYEHNEEATKREATGYVGLVFQNPGSHPRFYEYKRATELQLGRELSTAEFEAEYWIVPEEHVISGTSVFDPVLCEVAYRWFSPPNALILDPFAGGSVRGVVASRLGRRYVGVDLSGRQLQANRIQASKILAEDNPTPNWIEGDSRNIATLAPNTYDFIFSCPPYADLECYSEDSRDLSTMTYEAFLEAYRTIIAEACNMLAPDRFAMFVVGDVRARDEASGVYRGLPSATIEAFRDAGLELYNEGVLITAVGSLPMRCRKQFNSGRKLGKTHQNVLIFLKGDARKATEACGPVEAHWPEDTDTVEEAPL